MGRAALRLAEGEARNANNYMWYAIGLMLLGTALIIANTFSTTVPTGSGYYLAAGLLLLLSSILTFALHQFAKRDFSRLCILLELYADATTSDIKELDSIVWRRLQKDLFNGR